jgi:hypothetical protein
MKKLLSILACALIVIPVFANTNMIGLNGGGSVKWYTLKQSGNTQIDNYRYTYLDGSISGANYFGAKDNVGIGYAFAIEKLLDLRDSDANEVTSLTYENVYAIAVSGLYKMPLAKGLQLELGAGVSGEFQDMIAPSENMVAFTTFSLIGSANVLYSITDMIALRAGLNFSTPISIQAVSTYEEVETTVENLTAEGFAIQPFVGVFCLY